MDIKRTIERLKSNVYMYRQLKKNSIYENLNEFQRNRYLKLIDKLNGYVDLWLDYKPEADYYSVFGNDALPLSEYLKNNCSAQNQLAFAILSLSFDDLNKLREVAKAVYGENAFDSELMDILDLEWEQEMGLILYYGKNYYQNEKYIEHNPIPNLVRLNKIMNDENPNEILVKKLISFVPDGQFLYMEKLATETKGFNKNLISILEREKKYRQLQNYKMVLIDAKTTPKISYTSREKQNCEQKLNNFSSIVYINDNFSYEIYKNLQNLSNDELCILRKEADRKREVLPRPVLNVLNKEKLNRLQKQTGSSISYFENLSDDKSLEEYKEEFNAKFNKEFSNYVLKENINNKQILKSGTLEYSKN